MLHHWKMHFMWKATSQFHYPITPPFGYTGDYTPVEVTSDPTSGLHTFAEIPRLYLNPSSDTGALATEVLESIIKIQKNSMHSFQADLRQGSMI